MSERDTVDLTEDEPQTEPIPPQTTPQEVAPPELTPHEPPPPEEEEEDVHLDAPPEEDIDDLVDLEQEMMEEEEQRMAEEEMAGGGGGGGFEEDEFGGGGGFFTEEAEAAASAAASRRGDSSATGTSSSAANADTLDEDVPARLFSSGCRECGSVGVQQNFLQAFGVSVCYKCQRQHPQRYQLLTQTTCLQTYLLPLQMLQQRLGFIEKKNPHKQAWGSMKLYWKQQVLALAREKYGSMAALDAAKQARDVARIAKDDARRRNAHRAAAKEAAFSSTLAASMAELEAHTPAEAAALLAQRTRGMASGAMGARASSSKGRKRRSKKGVDGEGEDVEEADEHDPLEGLTPAARKRVKKEQAAQANKKLHTHVFEEVEEGQQKCKECGFVVEYETF